MSDFISGVLSRENEIIRLIRLLSDSKLGFIVVGGYAVSVHKKRFSIDLDIAVKDADVSRLESLLEKEGYASGYSKEISALYGEKFKRLEKKTGTGALPVSIDLLINGVKSRLNTEVRKARRHQEAQDCAAERNQVHEKSEFQGQLQGRLRLPHVQGAGHRKCRERHAGDAEETLDGADRHGFQVT